jgi:hypothetical protein
MPGKPFQSKLKPYETELREILASGVGFRGAAQEINRRHELDVSHNAVFSFLKSRPAPHAERGLFYEGLPADIRDQLLKRLAAEWTHESTAIEGNTLTLGETVKILELGLTIGGKPLRDHQEVYGHARAIDLIYEMVGRALAREDLFALHRAVMPLSAVDSLNPVGDWKRFQWNDRRGGRQERLYGIRSPSRCAAIGGSLADRFQQNTRDQSPRTGRCRLFPDAYDFRSHPSLLRWQWTHGSAACQSPGSVRRLSTDRRANVTPSRLHRPPLALPKRRRPHRSRKSSAATPSCTSRL